MAEVKSKFKNLFRHNKQVIKENETAPNKGPSGPNIMSKPPTFTELFSHSLPYLVNESMAFNKVIILNIYIKTRNQFRNQKINRNLCHGGRIVCVNC